MAQRSQGRRGLWGLAALVLSGCVPSVSAQGPELVSVGLTEVGLSWPLTVHNPWPVALSLGVDAAVESSRIAVGTVSSGDVRAVPAGGAIDLPLAVRVDTQGLVAASGQAWVDVVGEVTLGLSGMSTTLPVSRSVPVPVLSLPQLGWPSLASISVDARAATVDLALQWPVDNPNALGLTLARLVAEGSVCGERAVEAAVAPVSLEADGSSALWVPVHLDVAALGRGLWRAVWDGRLTGEVGVEGEVITPFGALPWSGQRGWTWEGRPS